MQVPLIFLAKLNIYIHMSVQMNVRKSNGSYEPYSERKLINIVKKVCKRVGQECSNEFAQQLVDKLYIYDGILCSSIRRQLEHLFEEIDPDMLAEYRSFKNEKDATERFVEKKIEFINSYKKSSNTANSTVDDNSNVANKNIAILNSEIHKTDNIQISRAMIMDKLKVLYPDFNAKQYVRDLEDHIIYKNDESSFAGAISPYCVSATMYPFLTGGIKGLGGLSASPKNLKSFCGIFCNMIFAMSSQFAGAVAVSEALMYFTYFCKKEWGPDFYERWDEVVGRSYDGKTKTILSEIHQYWQQIIYTINQPAAARGFQSAFVNFSYFDKYFFEGMFGDFYFPDGTQPDWESLKYVQMEFMKWFNAERLRTVLTFPVESVTLLYKDGHFLDQEMFDFVCEEYARGHSFFTYISDTVDSLSSCCRLKNKIQVKEFNFTNGNIGVQTGSKSVITFNLSRITQNWYRKEVEKRGKFTFTDDDYSSLKKYYIKIMEKVYKYHTAYNELLWDMYDADLLPVYTAGFIDLNKQYMTLGLNGLNQAAEFLGMTCNDNPTYARFCQEIFSLFSEQNALHKVTEGPHKLTFNTEQVPAESLAAKNYKWDKEDGYWVPEDTNLYASYIFKPNDATTTVLEKIRMHGRDYIGDYLDGGSAAHINLDSHLSAEQYRHLLNYAGEVGCSYITFNIPMTECKDCGHIVNVPVDECPFCHSKNLKFYTRIIGYLTAVANWANPRKNEFKDRVFAHIEEGKDNNINEGGYIGYNKYDAK
jgi:ribonucleoside-triphosphate reductase